MKRLFYYSMFVLVTGLLLSAKAPVKEPVFLQLMDANGKMVRGSSVARGFERQIEVWQFSGVSSGNPELRFSMPSGSASSALAASIGVKGNFQWAVFSLMTQGSEKQLLRSTVRLEVVTILSSRDTNGTTEVTLRADRIGTTHYEWSRKSGVLTVAGKDGYDFKTGTTWNTF
jgi:hypothetical protein